MSEDTKLTDKLAKIIAGNIDDAPAQLGDLSAEELQQLHDAEELDGKRKGMLEAIHSEQVNRANEAEQSLGLAQEAAQKAGQELASPTEVQSLREEVEALSADLKKAQEAAKQARKAPKAKQAGKARVLQLGAKHDDDLLTVAFTDRNGRTIPDLPELEFDEAAFTAGRDGSRILNEAIIFPESPRRFEVHTAWLVDGKGRAGMKCQMIAPISVGGGSQRQIGSGFLAFRGEQKSRIEREAESLAQAKT